MKVRAGIEYILADGAVVILTYADNGGFKDRRNKNEGVVWNVFGNAYENNKRNKDLDILCPMQDLRAAFRRIYRNMVEYLPNALCKIFISVFMLGKK